MENAVKVWITRDKDGSLWVHPNIPFRENDVWFCDEPIIQLDSSLFPSVKWEDDKPTEAYISLAEPQEQPKQEIDWEQRRYEFIKDILIKAYFEKKTTSLYDIDINLAISYANKIIDKLKEQSK